jgi:23S rRNA pseudouridine1911/1915/1917 synthase
MRDKAPMSAPVPPDALVLDRDDRHLYLFKPAGLPVFAPHDDPAGDCLAARVAAAGLAGEGPWPPGFEAGLAHRLDTVTSGVVVAARTPEALAALRAAFAAASLRKFYVFESAGRVDFTERIVTAPIAHHPSRKDRMVCPWPDRPTPDHTPHRGKWYPAWTCISRRGAAWQAEIRTGVMHQVRVHAAFVGLALTGDRLYGGAPGAFRLHHARIVGDGWRSPWVEPPAAG